MTLTPKAFDTSPTVLYIGQAFDVQVTDLFEDWLDNLRDRESRNRIAAYLRRVSDGNMGNAKSVGDGVHELRLKFGPGYRAYFMNRNNRLIVLLCGGDKSSQQRDIALAKEMAKDIIDDTKDQN